MGSVSSIYRSDLDGSVALLCHPMITTSNRIIMFNILYLGIGLIGLWSFGPATVIFWLLFAIGNGTVGHRYFAHNSFTVSRPMHWLLSAWCALSAYSPPLYWQVQHRHHHRHSDTSQDIHTPANGILMALFGWPFSQTRIDSVFQDRASKVNWSRARQDPAVRIMSDHYIAFNLLFLLTLGLIDPSLLLAAGTAVVMEHARLGLINTVCHLPNFPGNYRAHHTKDTSHNNLILGLLGLGFGWHNNHHNEAGRLILTERWWEIDLEGQVGRLLSKL